jgi:hypothetical protein
VGLPSADAQRRSSGLRLLPCNDVLALVSLETGANELQEKEMGANVNAPALPLYHSVHRGPSVDFGLRSRPRMPQTLVRWLSVLALASTAIVPMVAQNITSRDLADGLAPVALADPMRSTDGTMS